MSFCELVFALSSPAQTLLTEKRLLTCDLVPGSTADGWLSGVFAKNGIRSSNLDNLKLLKGAEP